MKDSNKFKVVESSFNASEAKVTHARTYRKGLARAMAQQLADKLNDKQSLNDNVDVMVSYIVHPDR